MDDTKIKSTNTNPINIYNMVLEGNLKTFPINFWRNKQNIISCTKYLLEKKLQWTNQEIKEKLIKKVFVKYKLAGMLVGIYNGSVYKLLNDVYPNRFKPWELNRCHRNYWNEKTMMEAIKWLIEEKLRWDDNNIKDKLTAKTLKDNNLCHLLNLTDDNIYILINKLYPNKFKPWELKSTSRNYWNKETAKNAMKWLIEEKLQWNNEDIKNKLTTKVFKDNGLIGMLNIIYQHSPYAAINSIYPNKFKPWELKTAPNKYWNIQTSKEAMRWLIEEKLQWNDDDIKNNLTQQIFRNNGLYAMLLILHKGSPYEAINNAYPNKFKKKDLRGYSKIRNKII